MITVGEYLANGRTKKNLTLEQVEKATKIRVKFLLALEKNQFDSLPDQAFTKGFIRNYATYLGLSPSNAMAFYRRSVDEGKVRILPQRGLKPIIRKFVLTPQIFTGSIVSIILILFFGYLIYSYFAFAGAPKLEISEPQSLNTVSKTETIKIAGKSDPEGTVTVNGQIISMGKDGNFNVDVPLQPGLNTFKITAMSKYQKETTVVKNVRLEK